METSFQLEEWLVDPLHGQIVGPAGPVRLEPRVMRVLVCLAERSGKIVSRDELIDQVWEGTSVTDEVLTQSVSDLRKALGEGPKEPRFIQTIPKQGYRLIAAVVPTTESGVERIVEAKNPDMGAGAAPWQRVRIAWTLGVALLVLAAIVAGAYFLREPDERIAVRLALTLPPAVFTETLAISPDGKWLAFIVADKNGNNICVRELESGKTQVLAGTEGVIHLFWSPDSRWVGFSTLSELKKVKPVGGASEAVRDTGFVWGGTWNDEGVMVLAGRATVDEHLGELFAVPAAGGEPRRLLLRDGLQGRARPFFLPDGIHFLYFATTATGPGQICVASLASGETRHLVESDSKGIYADGQLLFSRGGVLLAQRFDVDTLRLQGEPRLMGQQLLSPGVFGRTDTPFSASQNGLLVFHSSSGAVGQLVWFDRQGRELGRVPQPPSGEYVNPSLSPDGRRIAANRRDPSTGNRDIWLVDAETSIASRFTWDRAPEVDPVWSPDGKRIAFSRFQSDRGGVWVKEVTAGDEELLWEATEDLILTDWSRDGQFLLCSASGEIQVLPVSRERRPWAMVVDSPDARRGAARFSPDGKWIAYTSNETGILEIYVMRFPDGKNKQRVSNHGGVHPVWGADGSELFYWGFGEGGSGVFLAPVMRVQIHVDETGLHHSLPAPLFEPQLAGLFDGRNNYAVAPGGQRFLLRRPVLDPPPVTVIVNWTAELKSVRP